MTNLGTDLDSLHAQPHIATAYSVVFVRLKKITLKKRKLRITSLVLFSLDVSVFSAVAS